jgi:hypothetical protein
MKEAIGRYDIGLFSLANITKPPIEPIIHGAPSMQIPTNWFRDGPQNSK